ncbi:DNA-binding transcriptional LysR family regulator [Rhodovulum imhoffii]|uniref:DNA-binding transcriptional LysR family regulator n=1 Tax=Rhodovulum imhoffii TaxID=365340 RepID=A0A2T5BST4_9RHOB|nr:LysR substrate-binding domain-containing protein [Rhodovulum imhoffii]MBK5933721.1 LysR family transcriptional regulator [Rhodovulum imhoffii]PTN02446.1 DNA-binding transcriptional LysR family regulator [Rhodovulum imhoffii]
MNLSFRQLNAFREVMRSGSISQAARSLGRTQPAVSSVIAGLETELGFKLFTREQSKLTPTPEAYFFLEECEAILTRLDQAKLTLQAMSGNQSGRLQIACHPAASGFFMPQVLRDFLSDKPEVEAALMMRSSRFIEELVASQQFDVGFAETPRPRPSVRQVDFDLDCICALPAGDPLAKNATITPEMLDGKQLALLYDDHPITRDIRTAFARRGVAIHRRFELQTILPGLSFVAAGLCYMICDRISAHGVLNRENLLSGLVFRSFAPRIPARLSLLTPAHRPQSLLSEAFCEHLKTHVLRMHEEVDARLIP